MATAKKTATVTPITAAKGKPAAKTGTAVAVKKQSSGAIISIQEELRAQAAAMGERTAPASGNSIRVTQDKQFALPDGQKCTELEVVIVDFIAANNFYEGAYDKDNMSPPACFAIGTNPIKLVPSKNSPQLQAEECSSCPMNAFGSAGKGKACKNERVLAVLPPGADGDTPLWKLKVSPTALKAFDSYVQALARAQMMPVQVVTLVTFDENADYPSLRFKDNGENVDLAENYARMEEAKEMLNAEPDVSKFGQTAAAPARGKAAPARRAAAGRR